MLCFIVFWTEVCNLCVSLYYGKKCVICVFQCIMERSVDAMCFSVL